MFTLKDSRTYFFPATREVLAGRSPYSIEGFTNPPWAVLPLIPMVILPGEILVIVCIIWSHWSR